MPVVLWSVPPCIGFDYDMYPPGSMATLGGAQLDTAPRTEVDLVGTGARYLFRRIVHRPQSFGLAKGAFPLNRPAVPQPRDPRSGSHRFAR